MAAVLAVALLLLGWRGAARGGDDAPASDPGPGPWAQEGRTYKALGVHPALPGVFGYERTSWDEGSTTDDAYLWVVRREGAPEKAYRVAAEVGEGGATTLTVEVVVRDADGEVSAPAHVASGKADAPEGRAVAVLAAVAEAEGGAADWEKALDASAPEGADPADTARRRWRAVARALEAAATAHPKHLGIRRDLVTAYATLLALEGPTPLASTLVLRIPAAIEEWWAAYEGEPTSEDATVQSRALVTVFLRTGLHAYAAEEAGIDEEDAELAAASKAIKDLGYEGFDKLESSEVEGWTVEGYRARGEPKAPGVEFARWTFGATPPGALAAPGVVYVLSERPSVEEGGPARFALHAQVGLSRRLLRLYGSKSPTEAEVRAFVEEHLRRSLQVRAPAASEAPK